MILKRRIHKLIMYCLIFNVSFSTVISGLQPFTDVTDKIGGLPVNKSTSKAPDTKKSGAINTPAIAVGRDIKQQIPSQGNNVAQANRGNVNPASDMRYSISNTQYQILVRLIHAEAGGEQLKGQVAVGAVLLNRIRSGKFPKSIAANVYRRGEFESVSNGYIWSEPSSSAYKAAGLALKGWDPTFGALYFYNPAKTFSRWIWGRPIHTRIGNHYFAG
jgi:spore germination cell wall hydrolase CwlJ-like protein